MKPINRPWPWCGLRWLSVQVPVVRLEQGRHMPRAFSEQKGASVRVSSHECECGVIPGYLSSASEQVEMATTQEEPREKRFTRQG